ncbi:MAG: iron-sulfur cluster assembly accessory protein [Candidatus Caldarchaeum sp.]
MDKVLLWACEVMDMPRIRGVKKRRLSTSDVLEVSGFPLRLTVRAVERVKRVRAKECKEDHFLRVGVKGGGCSGLEYVLRLDKDRKPIDQSADFNGLEVVVDSRSAEFLQGATLDYTGGLVGSGFVFDNPNAVRGCGCGSSFTPK